MEPNSSAQWQKILRQKKFSVFILPDCAVNIVIEKCTVYESFPRGSCVKVSLFWKLQAVKPFSAFSRFCFDWRPFFNKFDWLSLGTKCKRRRHFYDTNQPLWFHILNLKWPGCCLRDIWKVHSSYVLGRSGALEHTCNWMPPQPTAFTLDHYIRRNPNLWECIIVLVTSKLNV